MAAQKPQGRTFSLILFARFARKKCENSCRWVHVVPPERRAFAGINQFRRQERCVNFEHIVVAGGSLIDGVLIKWLIYDHQNQ
jgi:hypothetical protein